MNPAALFAADPARSIHWLFPEPAELIYGGIAVAIIVGTLIKFAGPAVKKGMAGRTERIQKELDASETARASADAEAAQIRKALGDIDAERERLVGEAEAQAEIVLTEGRARLDQEIADLEARAVADAEAAQGRSLDELRGEISLLASAAVERIVAEMLDDQARADLVEEYIARVGASAAQPGGVSA